MRPIEFGFGFYLSLSGWSVSDPVVWMCARILRRHVIGVSEKEYLSVVKTIHLDLLQWFALPTLGGESKFFLLQRGSMISLWASSREYFHFIVCLRSLRFAMMNKTSHLISPCNWNGFPYRLRCTISKNVSFHLLAVWLTLRMDKD